MLICFAFLGGTIQAFLYTMIAYAASIGIALSPIGEAILRLLEELRRPETREEIEYLNDVFGEVYGKAKLQNSRLSENIEVFIIDRMYVNAFAIGRKTVAVTRGALETFSREELKGVLAHELGHISHGDTIGLLLNVVGNGIFSVLIIFARLILFIVQLVISTIEENFVFCIVFQFFRFMLEVFVLVFILIGEIILAINSRNNEYNADRFAGEMGYTEELCSALYLLQKISLPSKTPIIERFRASHPNTANRIERLEAMQFA